MMSADAAPGAAGQLSGGGPLFDNAKDALKALRDYEVFERVAVYVLRARHEELRLTGPSGDLGRDAFGRRLFAAKDEVVLMTSLEDRWTAKLSRELANTKSQPTKERAGKAIFVTNRSTKQTTQKRYKDQAVALGVTLEVFDLNELALELDGDALRWIAENELGVRPRQPRVLVAPAEFFEQMSRSVPGVHAAIVGRDEVLDRIQLFVADRNPSAPRILVVEGRGGVGKTRVAVEGAFRAATTLVARTATSVNDAALCAVPLDAPAVVVIDDAHRSRDLSGLAAMVGDSQFKRVKIILTVRPGLADLALDQAGLIALSHVHEELQGLDRGDIDAIVVGQGINDPEFVHAVISLAEGSPLIAHAACELANTQRRFSWHDAADVLEAFVVKRLLAATDDEMRAAAVALALLSSAESGEDLARLAGAVTSLPSDIGRLDTLLADLADAGLADAGPDMRPTYTVRPHLTAPLLVAQALRSTARVRLKVDRALPVLGRGALRSAGEDPNGVAGGHAGGELGIGQLSNGSLTGTWLHTSLLATQLQVLAQAAVHASDHATTARLRRAVRELLPKHADSDVWRDVLVLAEQVVPAAPTLFDDVRTELLRQWPPAPTQTFWADESDTRYRSDIHRLADQVCGLVSRAGDADPAAATRLLLTVATAASPYLNTRDLDGVVRGIEYLATPGGRPDTETLFARRRLILDLVVEWARAEFTASSRDPTPLRDRVRSNSRRVSTERVLMRALRPFLTPVIETTRLGTRDAADVLVLSNGLLPDDPRTSAGLADAADAVVLQMTHIDVADEASAEVLRALVDLPRLLFGIGARGLPRTEEPLPAYARTALADVATKVGRAITNRWNEMPLWARHAAALACVRSTPREARSLAQRAVAGDVLAIRARDDVDLNRMFVLVPIEGDLQSFLAAGPAWQRSVEHRHAAAVALARELPWREALDLLRASRDIRDDMVGDSPRTVFAEYVGSCVDDPAEVRALLRQLVSSASLPVENHVITGLLRTHPQLVTEWLLEVSTTQRGVEIGLAVLRQIGGPAQDAVLDAAHGLIVSAAPDAGRAADQELSGSELPTPADVLPPTALLGVAAQAARRLAEGARNVRLPSIGSVRRRTASASARQVLRAGSAAALVARAVSLGRLRDTGAALAGGSSEATETPDTDGQGFHDREAATYALGVQLALALFRGTGDPRARMTRLIALGLEGPPALTPRVLQFATYAMRRPAPDDDIATASPAQMARLVSVLQRRLDWSKDISIGVDQDHDTAHAVAALIEAAPDELADLVAARLLDRETHGGVWPYAWRDAVGGLDPPKRAPFALALRARIDAARGEALLDEVHQFDVDRVLAQIAEGTEGWPEAVMRWAQGGPADRNRAVASVTRAWRQPVWASVVSTLLIAGLDPQHCAELLSGIEMTSFGPDIVQRAEERLEVLRRLEPLDHPAVQAFRDIASSRLKAAVEEYQRDAEHRRRGYA